MCWKIARIEAAELMKLEKTWKELGLNTRTEIKVAELIAPALVVFKLTSEEIL